MHVRTYSPNFAPPHFAAGGIPKTTPHGTREDHTAYIYILSVYPFLMEFFSFSRYTKHTLLHGLIFSASSTVLREAQDVDAIIVTVSPLQGKKIITIKLKKTE